jgi:hypothetical protein
MKKVKPAQKPASEPAPEEIVKPAGNTRVFQPQARFESTARHKSRRLEDDQHRMQGGKP